MSKIEATIFEPYLLVRYIKTGQISCNWTIVIVVFQVCVFMLIFDSYDYVYIETKKIQGLFASPTRPMDQTSKA